MSQLPPGGRFSFSPASPSPVQIDEKIELPPSIGGSPSGDPQDNWTGRTQHVATRSIPASSSTSRPVPLTATDGCE